MVRWSGASNRIGSRRLGYKKAGFHESGSPRIRSGLLGFRHFREHFFRQLIDFSLSNESKALTVGQCGVTFSDGSRVALFWGGFSIAANGGASYFGGAGGCATPTKPHKVFAAEKGNLRKANRSSCQSVGMWPDTA